MIRKATVNDVSLIADFGARTFKEAYAASTPPEELAEYVISNFNSSHIEAQLKDQSSTFILAYLAGELVGYSMLWADVSSAEIAGSNPVELVRIYVDTKRTSEGFGSSLIEACLRHSEEAGHDVIWLGVWEKNERAIAFYKKWGFKKTGLKEFLLGNEVQRDLIMSRKIF
jgi:diamine N-acetyltransferase